MSRLLVLYRHALTVTSTPHRLLLSSTQPTKTADVAHTERPDNSSTIWEITELSPESDWPWISIAATLISCLTLFFTNYPLRAYGI